MPLLFNMQSRLVIAFLPKRKRLLISWLQSPSAVILEPKKIKSVSVSTVPPSISHEVMGPDAMILVFWMLSFKPTFHYSFTFIKRLFSSSLLSAIMVASSAYLRLLIFFLASGSFPMSQFFTSGSKSIGVSGLPVNIQDWFPSRLTGLISLKSRGLSRVFSNTTILKHQFFGAQLSL